MATQTSTARKPTAGRRAPARPPKRRGLLERTPVAEWTAAGLGLILTLGVIGYSLWEGLTDPLTPPALSVAAEAPQAVAGGYVTPITVRNSARETAAAVEVRGVLEQDGQVVEERRATFAYVPGSGEAKGGLMFEHDPTGYVLKVTAEGYEEP